MTSRAAKERLYFCLRQAGELVKRGDSLQDAMTKLEQGAGMGFRPEIATIQSVLLSGNISTSTLTDGGMLSGINKVLGTVRQQQGDMRAAFQGIFELFLDKPRRFHKLTADTTGLMMYLIGIVVLAVITASIYLIYVLPEFEKLFQNQNAELPKLTALLLEISKGPTSIFFLVVVTVILSPVYFLRNMQNDMNRLQHINGVVRHIPLLGRTAHVYNQYLSLCLLRIFNMAGIPDKQATTLLGEQYIGAVEKGGAVGSVNSELAVATQLGTFSYELQYQLAQQEACGDDEFNQFKDTISIIGIVIVASIVGILVMAMYLPIFQLGKILG